MERGTSCVHILFDSFGFSLDEPFLHSSRFFPSSSETGTRVDFPCFTFNRSHCSRDSDTAPDDDPEQWSSLVSALSPRFTATLTNT